MDDEENHRHCTCGKDWHFGTVLQGRNPSAAMTGECGSGRRADYCVLPTQSDSSPAEKSLAGAIDSKILLPIYASPRSSTMNQKNGLQATWQPATWIPSASKT